MNKTISFQKTTVLIVLAALLVLAVAAIPGAQAKGSFKSCADKSIKVKVDDGEEGGVTTVPIPVKKVSIKGGNCAKAYKFFGDYFSGQNPDAIKGYNCKPVDLPVPTGFYGQSCTKGGTTIKYATRGG
jgi:hypothetical protein